MVERLDAAQPTFPLPPFEQIPDDDDDRPKLGIRIVGGLSKTPIDGTDLLSQTTWTDEPPAVIFGAAAFSQFYSTDDHIQSMDPLRVTRLALRYGISAFDTSPYYGPSEIILGNALEALKHEFPRSSYQLFTKCGRFGNTRADFDLTREGVNASVSRSLARLHTDYLDTVYVHDVEFIAESRTPRAEGHHLSALCSEQDAYGLGEDQAGQVLGDGDREVLGAIAALRELQDRGVVRRVGISGYPLPTLLRVAILVLLETGKPLDVVMSYSHLNLQNRMLESFRPAFLERAKVKYVVSASPLNMGLLSPKPPPWHPASEEIKAAVTDAIAMHNKRIDGEQNGPTFSEVALRYAFERALKAQIPTVSGLCRTEEVHTCARVWHDLQTGEAKGELETHVQAVLSFLKDKNVLDQSWRNPSFG